MAIQNRNLPAGTKLTAVYKKRTYVCTVEAGEDGRLAFAVDGKRYSSPSSAGSAVMGGTACNGWRFWTVDGGEPPVSDSPATVRAAKQSKAKSPATKLIRRIPGTGLADGEKRFW